MHFCSIQEHSVCEPEFLRDRRHGGVWECVNWTREMQFRVLCVSVLQSEAPQGVFFTSTLLGIFSLHPVRHSCDWLVTHTHTHTHTHAHTYSLGRQLQSNNHTDVRTHKRGFERERRLLQNLRSLSLTVAMVALMSCVRVCVLCMCENGGRRKWDSAGEVWKKLEHASLEVKTWSVAREENRSGCRHRGTKHTRAQKKNTWSVPKVAVLFTRQ